jgi:hypothetical protein
MIVPIGDSSILSSLNWVSCQSSSTGSYNALLRFPPQLWSMEVKPNHFVPQEACAKAIYCPCTYLSCAKIGNIFGVKMNVSGPAITYVMFADDLMLFAKGNKREVGILNDCLDTYFLWSGQKINREKSGIIFSKAVHNDTKRLDEGRDANEEIGT